jgi:hypothetical protein
MVHMDKYVMVCTITWGTYKKVNGRSWCVWRRYAMLYGTAFYGTAIYRTALHGTAIYRTGWATSSFVYSFNRASAGSSQPRPVVGKGAISRRAADTSLESLLLRLVYTRPGASGRSPSYGPRPPVRRSWARLTPLSVVT